MTGLTRELGEFIARTGYKDLPEEALPLVRDAFTDTVGVMMAGVSEPIVDIVRRTLLQQGDKPEARACLSPMRVRAQDAALVGGTAAHALDYDDQSLTGHPSAVLVPAILAEGEALGATGQDLVTAYVVGYEVWAELIRRDSNHHRKGWHPTSVFGTLGAAAAISALRRLPAERASTALAIAASHAGGLGVNFGTMTKPYHAGRAAHDGIVSARLAAAGATAGADALENDRGYLFAFSFAGKPDRESPVRLGKEWYLPRQRLCIKKYPTCYFMHRSFDATVKMLEGRNLRADDIAAIDVTMSKGQTAVLVNERPQTGLEAKFSEQFAMAAAVILGSMDIPDLSDAVVRRPEIQAFFPKVKVEGVDEHDSRDPAHSVTERVVVSLANGQVIDSGPIGNIRGHAYDPMSTDELWTKFLSCTAQTHAKSDAKVLFESLQAVEKLPSTAALKDAARVFAA